MAQRREQAALYSLSPEREARVSPRTPGDTPDGTPTSAADPRVRSVYSQQSSDGRMAPMTVRNVQIPDLYCPFDPAVHRDVAEVHAQSIAWAKAMGLAPNEAQVKALHKAKVGWLVGRAFPVAHDLPALQIAADWTTLFCLIDNKIETIRGPAVSHVYLKSLLNVFREGAAPVIVDPFSQAFRDLRERMLAVNVPAWIERFGEHLDRLFRTFVDEAKYRHLEAVPELGIYRKMREVSVGLYFGFRLGELTDTITLPAAVREDPTVRSLESKAAYIVGLANDIYTIEKEMAKGEVNNMVLVLMQEEHLDFDQALARAVELHDTETREYSALTRRLPSFTKEVDEELRRYVDVLTSMISGHRTWATETTRYSGGDDTSGVFHG